MESIKTEKNNNITLNKSLKNRHIQMIAIGGAIGTGLFYGSAVAIGFAGPSVILGYILVGLFVLMVLRSMGELNVDEPSSGSYSYYSNRELGPVYGYLSGWTAWYTSTAATMAEIVVVGIYINFWYPSFPTWVTGLIFLAVLTTVNLMSVKFYGEFEFWFAMIKVVAIIAMIIFGLMIIIFGIGNGGTPIGFDNLWKNGGFFPNGITGFAMSLVFCAFAFGGIEYLGSTSGETQNPEKTIPKAINSVLYRILIFYVGAILVIVSIYPWDQIGTLGSPFVLVFAKMGIPGAATIINFVVLTAALSSINTNFYVCARMTYSLALTGNGPKTLAYVGKKSGVPIKGVLLTSLASLIAIPMSYFLPSSVFTYLTSFCTMGIMFSWSAIVLSAYAFRKRKIADGTVDSIKFKAPFYPFGAFATLAFLILIVILMGVFVGTRLALIVFPIWIIALLILYQFTPNKVARRNKNDNTQINE